MSGREETTLLAMPVGARDHTQGLATAPVTLVEYGDYECPYTGEAYPIVKEGQRRLGARPRFVFRNFPLTTAHPHAPCRGLVRGRRSEMHDSEGWPALPLAAWQETYDTLHMWTQILGKIRLKLTPHVNHWWEVPFYLTSRGLTSTPIPYGDSTFDATFDFIDHVLVLQTSGGRTETIALRPRSVADFYHDVMATLQRLAIDVRIWTKPQEYPDPIRFEDDRRHASYDAAYAHRFWRILLRADTIFKEFRGRFIGKASPVHFFWGGFDLAVTRFSGRRAPVIEGADSITREGYSHEVSSCGFWPGSGSVTGAAFYSYAAPEPPGFKEAPIRPAAATYNDEFSNFVLMYDDVRSAEDPRATVLEFLQSTYEAAATLGHWDRENLEFR